MGAAAYARNHERGLWQERTHDSRASSATLLGKAKEAWQNLSVERKVMYGIIGLNVGVFGLWRLPILQVRLPECSSSSACSVCAMQAAGLDYDFAGYLFSWKVSCASLVGCDSDVSRAPSAVLPCAGCHVKVVPHADATPEDAAGLHSANVHFQPCKPGSLGLQHDCLQLLWGQHEPGALLSSKQPLSPHASHDSHCSQFLPSSMIAKQGRLPIYSVVPSGTASCRLMFLAGRMPASWRGDMLMCISREGWRGTVQVFGGEQFLFFFLTAGMVSSLTSYAGRLRSLKGGHSLGASGAVYACFAGMAILYPGMHAPLPPCIHPRSLSHSCRTQIHCPAYPRNNLLP